MSHSSRRARTVIDSALLERLEILAGAAIARFPDVAYPLVNKLTAAELVERSSLPPDVVTIGNEVLYRDHLTARDLRVRLSWPEQADISQGVVSILTPVGVALLGLAEGDQFQWTTRAGAERGLTVLQVEPSRATAEAEQQ
ncbi:nucleoside diphosphate kinase regulator [Cereibacter changlensis JA139]|uniref:Nucleoside diphosphate kinase regulator n=2 Tax=Cereibacter changlensis TaxID=402884 RepID=A0A2T4JPU9_9RHOB|nr:nucleoside diphosphate kinase regulator [Cereibacter changlensis]PTE19939.1 nucleoside diphosphate kinase regulator [Cereibacter changlensis JA139]PZX56376.1 regulator of nucleoside diphosphate kinase [Cereibacter changlensis]